MILRTIKFKNNQMIRLKIFQLQFLRSILNQSGTHEVFVDLDAIENLSMLRLGAVRCIMAIRYLFGILEFIRRCATHNFGKIHSHFA